MSKFFALAVAALGVIGASFPALAYVGPSDYVRRGLVALYDGVYNAKDASGNPVHDSAPTVWANLVAGTDDAVLPAGYFTVGPDSISLTKSAVASNCTAKLATWVTLETCAYGKTLPASTVNVFHCVNLNKRATIGFDRRGYGVMTVLPQNTKYTSGSNQRYWSAANGVMKEGTMTYSDFGMKTNTISSVVPLAADMKAGYVNLNGTSLGTPKIFWTDTSAAYEPDGRLWLGCTAVEFAVCAVRVYNVQLTDDERMINNAIDQVRFKGADPQTVSLPSGYSFDAETNLVSTAHEEQHRVTKPGTVTFEAPYDDEKSKQLYNAALGLVTFDESAQEQDAAHAISFAGFGASGSATTLFKGGWWDFCASDFFLSTATSSSRTTVFDGAVVTNVGAVHVAGTSGDNNRLDLVNGARLYPSSMVLGWKNGANQRSRVTVSDGSTLQVSGALKLSDSATQCKQITLTGNELVVSNAGSRLVVKGTTGLAQTSTEGTYGAPGGNTLTITDKAVADLQDVSVSSLNMFNVSNRVTVSKGALLTTENLYCSSDASYSGFASSNWNRFEVLDGAVWTNRNQFQMGQYQHDRHNDNVLLVSNATFCTKYIGSSGGGAWFLGARNKIIISGPKAKFTVQNLQGSNFTLFNDTCSGSELIVENGADWTLPMSHRYSYMHGSSGGTLVARTGGIFRTVSSLATGDMNAQTLACLSKNNGVRVESDGVFIPTELRVLGLRGTLTVDSGRFQTSGLLNIGNYKATDKASWYEVGSNCVMRLKGDHPSVAAKTVSFANKVGSTLEINLPETGYLATHACSTQALVSATSSISFGSEYASIVLNGAEALQAHQMAIDQTAKYVLLSAPTLTVPDAVVAAAQATLPSRCKLQRRTVTVAGKTRNELILRVSGAGLAVFLR